ncbi:MAG: hypothetical protein U1E65_31760 [Myxococcota bacterium]
MTSAHTEPVIGGSSPPAGLQSLRSLRTWVGLGIAAALFGACFDEASSDDSGSHPDGAESVDGGAIDRGVVDSGGGADAEAEDAMGNADAEAADAGGQGPCALEVEPSSVEFGFLEPGRPLTMPVTLHNAGGADCHLSVARTSAGNPEFRLLPPSTTTVAPGQRAILEVRYRSASLGIYSSALELVSESGPIDTQLTAGTSSTTARVVPASWDFGSVASGCQANEQNTVFWVHQDNVWTLSSTSADATTPFSLAGAAPPYAIHPDRFPSYAAHFASSDLGPSSARFSFFLTPRMRIAFPVQAKVVDRAAMVEDVRVQRATPIDILIIANAIPRSAAARSALGTALEPVIDALRGEGVDALIKVVPGDDPAAATLIHGSDGNAGAEVRAAIEAISGASNTALLDTMDAALSYPYLADFPRDDARLSVVLLTDQEEHPRQLSTIYYQHILNQFSGREGTSFSAFVYGPRGPAGCAGPMAALNRTLDALSTNSGGVAGSICAISGDALHALWKGQHPAVPLSSRPSAPNLIAVTVDGTEVPSGASTWTYLNTHNQIRFADGAAPPLGASIRVRYPAPCFH